MTKRNDFTCDYPGCVETTSDNDLWVTVRAPDGFTPARLDFHSWEHLGLYVADLIAMAEARRT